MEGISEDWAVGSDFIWVTIKSIQAGNGLGMGIPETTWCSPKAKKEAKAATNFFASGIGGKKCSAEYGFKLPRAVLGVIIYIFVKAKSAR